MQTLYYLIKIIRPLNVLISGSAIICSAAILNSLHQISTLVITTLVVMCYTAAANTINDALDANIDKVNRPLRPIPSGKLNKRVAINFSFLLFAFGSVLCIQLPTTAIFIGVFLSMPLLIIYSIHLKGQPLIGNFMVSLIIGLSFLFCGASFNNISPLWIPGFLSFGLTLIREIVKDIADVDGDNSVGHQTFPIKYGIDKTIKLIFIISLFVGLFAMYPYIINIYSFWYAIIVIIGVEIPLIVIVFLLRLKPINSSAILGAKILKFSSIMGLLAIYMGSIS